MKSFGANSARKARWPVLLAVALACAAQNPASPPPSVSPVDPNELVNEVVYNELHEEPIGEYRFREWMQTSEGSKTRELVESKDGVVSRLVALNERPLTAEQEKTEQDRLKDLLAHPEIQQQKKKEQQQDEERMQKMFRELPHAFLYQLQPSSEPEVVHLSFVPNPGFEPASREATVFRGMSGQMWIAARDKRLLKIEGTLFRDVTFGWGLLGRLEKGGHFSVRQAQVGPGRWEVVELDIHFSGKALLFKSISLREFSRFSDFQPVPQLTLAQAVDLLTRIEPAQTASNGGR